jgi:beta-glucuronidase
MTSYPHYPKRKVTLLDGVWDMIYLGDQCDLSALQPSGFSPGEKAIVPGCFDTRPDLAGKRGTALYRTHFFLSPNRAGELRFHGLGLWCRIYVDGDALFEGAFPYSGFSVSVPPAAEEKRQLDVFIDNRFDFDRVPLQEQFFDFYAYGGIYRSVELRELPAKPIRRLQVIPRDPVLGEITLRLIPGYETEDREIRARISIDEGVMEDIVLSKEGEVYTAENRVSDPEIWSPASPRLYTITLETEDDAVTERFGLRSIACEKGRILLNGKPVKLLGFCRHEAHPQFGPALPLEQLQQDLLILRDLGSNFIRGSHYPQDPRFLDLCDEMGFLVWEESIGWGQREKSFSSPDFHKQQVEQTRLMVRNSINHPSIIMWGFLNEGASNEEYARPLYTDLFKTIREEDKSRPATYASMFPFEDLFWDLADIISINKYPGWYAEGVNTRPLEEVPAELDNYIREVIKKGLSEKPVLISEMGAGAFYGWRDPHHAHWSEEYQADFLDQLTREITARPEYCGISLWQYCDCRTYDNRNALSRPRGFNNKGIVDEYRRPKLAYERVKENFRKSNA